MTGIVDLAGIPGAAIDTEAIRAAGASMAPLGPVVADGGEQTVRAWRQVGTYYIAPETPVLLAALDKIVPMTQQSEDRITGLSRALTTYAEQAEPIIAALRRLSTMAGPATPEQAAQVAALTARLAAVEQECAAAVKALTAADLAPVKVRVSEHVEKVEVLVTAGHVKVGQNASFKVTTFSDDTVSITAVDGGELGGTGSIGGVIDLGGGLKIEVGSIWRFQDIAEAEKMLGQLRAHVAQQQAATFVEGGAFGAAIADAPPLRPPDQILSEAAIQAEAGGKADVGVAEGSVKGEGSRKETVNRDLTNGTTTTILTREGSAEGKVGVTPLGVGDSDGVGGKRLTSSTREVTRDATGRITKIQLTATENVQGSQTDNIKGRGLPDSVAGQQRASGLSPSGLVVDEHKASRVKVTTTTLDVTDQNRAVVEQWVARGEPDGKGATGDPTLHYPDTAVPGDDFQNVLQREARVSRATFEEVSDKDGIEAEAKAGPKLGVKASVEETSTRAVEASHLDVIGPDGKRPSVPDPDGVAR